MKNRMLIALSVLLISYPVFCQSDSDNHIQTGNLYFSFRSISFIRDDEYSNPIIEGYTLPGFFIQPEFVYAPAERLQLRLGAHLLSYSGTDRFTLVKPVFSAKWYISPSAWLMLGTLAGSDSHRMSDPHFNKERLYNAYSEDGAQFRFMNEYIFSDAWLSWENFIFRGDTSREIFTAGESFRFHSPGIRDHLWFEVPVQLQFKHYGGQISNYPQEVETYFNTAAGIRINLDIGGRRFGTAALEALIFNNLMLTKNAPSGINKGYGQWYRFFYNYSVLFAEAGYWKGHNFYAPNGDFIFGSVSDHIDNLVIPDRELVTCSAGVQYRPYRFMELYLAFDGYYDTGLKRFDTALTLHLRFNKLFRIARIDFAERD